jgi:hypothetical protein
MERLNDIDVSFWSNATLRCLAVMDPALALRLVDLRHKELDVRMYTKTVVPTDGPMDTTDGSVPCPPPPPRPLRVPLGNRMHLQTE